MMIVMSQVATPNEIRDSNPNIVDENIVEFCEEWIDSLTSVMGKSEHFILPRGNIVSSHLHLARTVTRRSERRLWTLNKEDTVPEIILKFSNRLSDLFFTMARYEMFYNNNGEERAESLMIYNYLK